MSRLSPILVALAAPLVLSACAVAPPTSPNVLVLPNAGKDLARFQQEDATCRGYAQQQIGYGSPQQAANQSAVGSAALGTGLGAAAGALLGAAAGNAGAGAAIGAGGGLLAGSAVGASNAGTSAGNLQQRYDIAYLQCMAANGNTVPTTAEGEPYLFEPYAYSGAYPGYYGYYGYPYYGPFFGGAAVVGVFGHRHFHHFDHVHHPWGGWHGGGWGGFRGGWHGGGGRHR
jgi:hypothetical protein